nr:M56 family metallopeptidase [uncultured Sphingomonas sp.]
MLALLGALAWKSALVAALALSASQAMRARPAQERVFLLRVAIMMLVALPIAAALLPAIELGVLPARAPADAVTAITTSEAVRQVAPAAPEPPGWEIGTMVAALYVIGSAALLLHLTAGVATLARWTRRATPVTDARWQDALRSATAGLRRPVRLLVSRDVTSPLSWGVAPAWILVDADSLARCATADAVTAHEAAHVRNFDWPMLIAARIAVAFYWFNPLVWLLARALARESEIAADEAAVRRVERLDYAQALLAFASVPAGHGAATGMALWPDTLRDRIARVVELRSHQRSSRILAILVLGCGIAAAPTLGAVELVHAVAPGQGRPASTLPESVSPRATPARVAIASARVVARVESGRRPSILPATPDREPVPTATISAIQSASGVTQLIGRTGAKVIVRPEGATIIGAPEDPAVEGRLSAEEGQRSAEDGRRSADQGRREGARSMLDSAADLRRQADNLERIADQPDQPESLLNGHRAGAQSLRDGAAKLEAEAAKMTRG